MPSRHLDNSEYKKIIHQSFSKHFADWDALSPLDPVRMIASSLEQSLSGIEARQQRLIDMTFDNLPALLSFEARPAVAPQGIFSLQGAKHSFAPGDTLTFLSGENRYDISFSKQVALLNIAGLKTKFEGKRISLEFQLKSPTENFSLYFVGKSVVPTRAIPTLFKEKREVHFEWKDGSDHFTKSGPIEFETARALEGPIRLQFEILDHLPQGEFVANAFEGAFSKHDEEKLLGDLKGMPWERVALPSSLLECPKEIDVLYPDEETVALSLMEKDILKLRRTDTELFERGFIYSATHHEIIVPNAHKLMGQFAGGVQLIGKGVSSCDETALNAELTVPRGRGQKLRFHCETAPFIPREKTDDFLTRFYSFLRSVPQLHKKMASVEELVEAIRNTINIRRIEAEKNGDRATLHIVDRYEAEKSVPSLTSETAFAVREHLKNAVVTDWNIDLRPFEGRPIEIELDLELQVSEERIGSVTEDLLTKSLKSSLEQYLGLTPNGLLRNEIDSESLEKELKDALLSGRTGLRLQEEELVSIRLLFLDPKTGRYLSQPRRRVGEWWVPSLKLELGHLALGLAGGRYA